ncbi:MAG TPA: DUF3824 domain-containing protein [Ktedonobacteraceae bacterium]|nr:DUF3824 domain-containing protein [Ktedonobacteraceae bacterium]
MYDDPNQPPQPPQNPYEIPPTQYAGQSSYEPTQYAGPPPYNPQQYGAPPNNPQQYGAPPPPYNPQQYGVPPVPGYAQAPQPQQAKRSLRWLWITLSIVGGVLVLSCIGCVFFVARGYNILAPTLSASVTASSYYQAIENQDYTKAYSYLANNMQTTSGQALTQTLFTQGATAKDVTDGQVTNFSQTNISTSNGIASVTMSVTRSGQPYVVQLKLQQINGNWVIIQFNTI